MTITLDTDIILKLTALEAKIGRRVGGALSIHGISFTEFLVMKHLSRSPNVMMRRVELAEGVGLTASGITRLLSPMEKIGLIKKEENARDARVSLVRLTSAGKSLFVNAEIAVNEASQSIMSTLKNTQKKKFLDTVEALL